jgi:hypothetical protein
MVTPDPRTLQAVEVYIATFAGRTDAYSFWTGGPDGHWKLAEHRFGDERPTQRIPLTPEVVVNAFRTNVPVSAYVLAPDSSTHIACLDIDRPYGMTLGKLALATLARMGAVGYLEPSARGCHLWIPLEEARPGVWVRRMLRGLIHEAKLPPCPGSGFKPVLNETQRLVCAGCQTPAENGPLMPVHDDPKLELRPAQDRLTSDDSVGICIRMPTMPHHRTGKRYRLISSDGELLPDRLSDMMLVIDSSPMGPLADLVDRAPLPKIPASPPMDLMFPLGQPSSSESASEILRSLWGMVEPKPGRANLCPAHDDSRPSLSIARDDQRVWCKNDACILSNHGRGRGTHELVSLAPKHP